MEIATAQWLSKLGMEDPIFIHQCEMNSLDEFTTQHIAAALGEDHFQHSFPSQSNSSYPTMNPTSNTSTNFSTHVSQIGVERPTKLPKSNSLSSCIWIPQVSDPSSPAIFSFDELNSLAHHQQFHGNLVSTMEPEDNVMNPEFMTFPLDVSKPQNSYLDQDRVSKAGQGTRRIRLPSQSQDHIIAERQRREKIGQSFIALSAIVPGLKKKDKTSVLEETIKYLKQLQDRVKTFEEQTLNKTMESVVVVKKSHLLVDDNNSSSNENFNDSSNKYLPEIEARVSDKSILIRIHCEKRKGVLVKTLAEVEKLHLIVVNSSLVQFGRSTLNITIVAQMENEFCMTVKDLVRNLHSAFGKFM